MACRRGEPLPLLHAIRHRRQATLPERSARRAERAGHDDEVAGPGPCAARNAVGSTERGDGQDDGVRTSRVAAATGTPLSIARVELDASVELRLSRQRATRAARPARHRRRRDR